MTQPEHLRDLADDMDGYRKECQQRGLPIAEARQLEYVAKRLRHRAERMERGEALLAAQQLLGAK